MDYYDLLYLLTRDREPTQNHHKPQPQHTTPPYITPHEWEKRRKKTNDR